MKEITLELEQLQQLLPIVSNEHIDLTPYMDAKTDKLCLEDTVFAMIPNPAADIVGDICKYGRDIHVTNRFCGSRSADIKTAAYAANQIQYVAGYIDDLKRSLIKADALLQYYAQCYAILNSCRISQVFFLSRCEGYHTQDGKVRYRIFEGAYNHELKHFEMIGEKIADYEGKQHREAAEKIAELVRNNPGSRGFKSPNGYTSMLNYEAPDFT